MAALAVAAFHYLGPNDPAIWGARPKAFAYPLHHAAMYGWLGVEAFFLISGFVICMSAWGAPRAVRGLADLPALPGLLVRARPDRAAHRADPDADQGRRRGDPPRVVLANLSMFPGALHTNLLDGVAWTLDVEARFYVLMAVVLTLGTTYSRILGFCCAWLVAAFVTTQTHATLLDQFVLSGYAGLFVSGIALYLMYRFGPNLLLWVLLGVAWAYQMTVLQDRVRIHGADWGCTGRCPGRSAPCCSPASWPCWRWPRSVRWYASSGAG
ncbi:acyltransferase family protein [Streptacidiphilus monticola]